MTASHKPRKRFGQNFLTDESIIDAIIRAIHAQKDQHLIEIGPGLGALTFELMDDCAALDVIEIDRDLVEKLSKKFQDKAHVHVHAQDALKANFHDLILDKEKIRIIGNLPYNISTPLLFHLLKFRDDISDMHFMLQKEVVDRITAKPGSKDYGRLSIMIGYSCETRALFNVPPSAFNPPPKVDSSIVYLRPYSELPFIAKDEALLGKLVHTAFSQRRKTLRNNIKALIDPDLVTAIGIDVGLRPEQISIEDYVKIANIM